MIERVVVRKVPGVYVLRHPAAQNLPNGWFWCGQSRRGHARLAGRELGLQHRPEPVQRGSQGSPQLSDAIRFALHSGKLHGILSFPGLLGGHLAARPLETVRHLGQGIEIACFERCIALGNESLGLI